MAKQRKTTTAPTLGSELAQATAPATPTQPAAPKANPLFVLGKKYRVKTNTKHAHDQHWDKIRAMLLDGPASFDQLAKLGEEVHQSNAIPYVRYCARRGWIVLQQQPE